MKIKIETLPEDCPFCHNTPIIAKDPMWHGNRGYYGNYEYYVACKNENCKIQPRTKSYNDIYNMTEQQCINKSIDDWNNR